MSTVGRSLFGDWAKRIRWLGLRLGGTDADLAAVPASADMGIGCGNLRAFASPKPGEAVLDGRGGRVWGLMSA